MCVVHATGLVNQPPSFDQGSEGKGTNQRSEGDDTNQGSEGDDIPAPSLPTPPNPSTPPTTQPASGGSEQTHLAPAAASAVADAD
jgi:hypothetical protein